MNLFILMQLAHAKGMTVGITTHRDLENTILYSLYHWQFSPPTDEADSLAATISYWKKNFFGPMDVRLDFVNARYQPLFKDGNYYDATLFPLEEELIYEISKNKLLKNADLIHKKINQYVGKKEFNMSGNTYKQRQILWLIERYAPMFNNNISVVHFDDSKEVFYELPIKILERANVFHEDASIYNIKTIHVDKEILLNNKAYAGFLSDIEVIKYAKNFIFSFEDLKLTEYNEQKFILSSCLALSQIYYDNPEILSQINKAFEYLEDLNSNLSGYRLFCLEFLRAIETQRRPIHLLTNNLRNFQFA